MHKFHVFRDLCVPLKVVSKGSLCGRHLIRITLSRMDQPHYRGRFAPSPTGPLHFGSLIAALGSYLEARSRNGEWLVRIEDLDPPRTVPGSAHNILRTLEACGMTWDGEVIFQSARNAAYHAALHALRGRDLVYPCACSRSEIADSGIAGIDGFVYPGTCRGGLPRGRAARALRLATDGAAVAFDDRVQGRITQHVATDIGDFVLYRNDQAYAYQLAVVVDDVEQGISDVVRGADLLDSTPRQIFLQQLLGLPTPRYAHLPVAVNPQGEKLSKQTLAAPIDASRPLPLLIEAMRFLGQPALPGPASTDLQSFWTWAIASWRIERVPRARRIATLR
jgi:glutamyl-Q tRNA(Asp) synthetase